MTKDVSGFQSAGEYIGKRLADGERDPDVLSAELMTARLRSLVAPLVRDYAEGRVRAYVRSLENCAGRREEEEPARPDSPAASSASTPLEARHRLLDEFVWIPGGTGMVRYADLTVEMAQARIAYMEDVVRGAQRSVRWLRAVIGAIERNGVRTFGEVPDDDPLFPGSPGSPATPGSPGIILAISEAP